MRYHFCICLPLEMVKQDFRGQHHLEYPCAVCKGSVGVNPQTFGGKLPPNIKPVCGACAVSLVEQDDNPTFALTKEQEKSVVQRAMFEIVSSEQGKRMIAHIKAHRRDYDASLSGKGEVN